MKNINPIITAAAILLGLLIVGPCFAKGFSSAFFSDVHERVIFRGSNISEVIRGVTALDDSEVIPDFIPHNISNEVELLSGISAKGKPVANVSAAEKTNPAPECRKYKCRQGLTDLEWEKEFHIFILCFFVMPFLSTLAGIIAGIKGWIRFD